MPQYQMYFVPLSSLTVQDENGDDSKSFVFKNEDIARISFLDRQTLQLDVGAPTTKITIDDTGTFSDWGIEYNDDLNFDDQRLAFDAAGFSAGTGTELNYSYLLTNSADPTDTITIYSVAIGGSAGTDTIAGLVATKALTPGATYTFSEPDSGVNPLYSNLAPCFTAGTLIRTQTGERPVDELAVGDMIETMDNGLQPIRWIGSRKLDAAALRAAPNLLPIFIGKGALSDSTPAQDLIVSPQHRVLVRSKIAQRMFDAAEVLVAAKQLLQLPNVHIVESCDQVSYYHILFDRHEIIYSNGAPTESLYTGAQALRALSPDARDEILTLFPELSDPDTLPQAARLLVPGRTARRLAQRHADNHQPLFG